MKPTTRYTIATQSGPLSKGQTIELVKGRPLADTPKTWNVLDSFMLVEMPTTRYNSNVFTLYRAKDGTLRYSVYRDGCFYAFHGRINTPDIAKEQADKAEGLRVALRQNLLERNSPQRWIANNARSFAGSYIRQLRAM